MQTAAERVTELEALVKSLSTDKVLSALFSVKRPSACFPCNVAQPTTVRHERGCMPCGHATVTCMCASSGGMSPGLSPFEFSSGNHSKILN